MRASLGGALRRWGGNSKDNDNSSKHDNDGNDDSNIGAISDNDVKVMRRLEEGRKAKESSRKDDCKIIEVRRREEGNREKETTSKKGKATIKEETTSKKGARIEVKDKSSGRSRWEQRSSTYSLQKTSLDEAQKPGDWREERQRKNNRGTIGVEGGMKRVPYLQVSKFG